MCCCIMGNRVAASRVATGTIRHSLVLMSIAPKTHWCLTMCPRWYFRRTSMHSSISTVWPTPPMITGFQLKCSAHTLRMKFFQSTTVWLLSTPNSCWKSIWLQYCRHHKYINLTTVAVDILAFVKKVPCLSDTDRLHGWHRHLSVEIKPHVLHASSVRNVPSQQTYKTLQNAFSALCPAAILRA